MLALIIENDVEVGKALKGLIETFCPEINEVIQAQGVDTGKVAIETHQPNLIFLDVELDDGTGMDLVKEFPNPEFQLIFVTAHNKYAVDAFKCCAIDFLQKPVDPDDLVLAVEKAKNAFEQEDLKTKLNALISNLDTNNRRDQNIVLKESQRIHVVKIKNIVHCEADGNYTKFNTSDGKSILVSKNLKEYENILGSCFFRVHHSHLINLEMVSTFNKTDGGSVTLHNGVSIPVSTRRKDELLQRIDNM